MTLKDPLKKSYADWVAVDWGTSNVRAWAMTMAGDILDHAASDQGMSRLTPDAFEPCLLSLVEDWLPPKAVTPVLACGMVGSKQGWVNAGYEAVPCPAQSADPFTHVETKDSRLSVSIVHGLKQQDPADVMRGEETQIAGLLALNPSFTGYACLPGTHSKWALIEDGQVTSFTTFMTGEMYQLLSKQSVLRHSIDAAQWTQDAFLKAIDDSFKHDGRIASLLFSVRASGLVNSNSPATANATLSGLLLGAELATMLRSANALPIAIIGNETLAARYQAALSHLNQTATVYSVETLTLRGLQQALSKRTNTEARHES